MDFDLKYWYLLHLLQLFGKFKKKKNAMKKSELLADEWGSLKGSA
jgi:hypothetical protein